MSKSGNPQPDSVGGYSRSLRAGQVDILYEQVPSSLFATLTIGLLLTFALWNFVSQAWLSLWFGAMALLSAGRFWLVWRYRGSKALGTDWSPWSGRFLTGVLLNGILWGLAGAYFFVPQSPIHQTLLGFALAGISAGAVTTLSPVRGAPLLFLLPALVPYTTRLFAYDAETNYVMGVMVALFVAMMWVISRRLHATVEKSLRLRFENVELVSNLTLARDVQEVAHRALTEQVAETQLAQQALRESHAELERRVQTRTRELEDLAGKLEATVADLDSESKEAEAARAAAESASNAKSQFLAVVSHELRTPLNVILGYQDLLAAEVAGGLNEVQHRYLTRAELAAQQLLGLIDQILNLARIEAGKEELKMEDAELSTITHEVAELVEPLAASKQLQFSVHVPDGRSVIRTDAVKLRQILLNLLSNAIKFTDQGRVELRASESGGRVIFAVIDTGPGIAPQDLARIFDAFTQAASNYAWRPSGTGLGLTVSRSLAELLGGSITVESALAKGSVFTLSLPAKADRPNLPYPVPPQ